MGTGDAMTRETLQDGSLLAAGMLLGVGLGGFLDGILLHQILQWHNMLSSWLPPVDLVSMKVNMAYDGLFHAFTWATTALGLALLWRGFARGDLRPSTPAFVGSLALGWGLFNVIEGLVNHTIFAMHHVHPGPAQGIWDAGFLLFGGLLFGLGWASIRHGLGQGVRSGWG
jgi:uncharacterized membrane protein